jgi:hypothetical protein
MMAVRFYNPRRLPRLEALTELPVDLRWTWTDAADHLWRTIDRNIWKATESPWLLLQEVASDVWESVTAIRVAIEHHGGAPVATHFRSLPPLCLGQIGRRA